MEKTRSQRRCGKSRWRFKRNIRLHCDRNGYEHLGKSPETKKFSCAALGKAISSGSSTRKLCEVGKTTSRNQCQAVKSKRIAQQHDAATSTNQTAPSFSSHMSFHVIFWLMAAWSSQSALTILASRSCFAASSANDFHSFCSGSLVPDTR